MPRYRELSSSAVMGKPTWANNIWGQRKHANGAADSSASWSWDAWEGSSWDAWSKGQGKGQPDKQDKRRSFPQYQDMKVQSDHKESSHLAVDSEDNGVDDIKQIQKFINAIRKAEARTRKLGELRVMREQQWKTFQDELQKSFMDQKKRYKADLLKLEGDLGEAQRQKDEAASLLKQYVGKGHSSPPTSTEPLDKDDLAEWMALTSESSKESRTEDADPWMQAMFQRTASGGSGLTMEERDKLCEWLDRQEIATTTPTRPTAAGPPRTPTPKIAAAGPMALRPFKSKARPADKASLPWARMGV